MKNVGLKSNVDQAISGDDLAFDRLVAGYRDLALGYARTLTPDREAAEDAVQEALLIAYRNLEKLADSEAFVGWLRGILRNRCWRGIRREHLPLHEMGKAPSEPSLTSEDLDSGRLTRALARLPQAQQAVLFMHYEEGLSQAEIAAHLGVSKAAVNMRMHAARERLRRRLIMQDDYSGNRPSVGHVEAANGPLITFRFAPKSVPPVFARLISESDELCVVRALPNRTVQAIPTRPHGIWTPGRAAQYSGEPFLEALPSTMIEEVAKEIGRSSQGRSNFLRTGIKSVDIFAPLCHGGSTGVFAEWGVGTMVLVPELIRRLEGSDARHSFFAFMSPVRDSKEWRNINAEVAVGSMRLETYYIPVGDPLSESLRARLSGLDSKLVLSRTLAEMGVWPCIDPLRSSSSMSGLAWTEVADQVRALNRKYLELQYSGMEAARPLTPEEVVSVRRGRMATAMLSQPFFVAEPFTYRSGIDAEPETAAKTFADILAGHFDDRKRDDFMMIGSAPT